MCNCSLDKTFMLVYITRVTASFIFFKVMEIDLKYKLWGILSDYIKRMIYSFINNCYMYSSNMYCELIVG